MRSVQSTTLLMGFLMTLVLSTSAVLAVKIDASVDKRIVVPGGTMTVTGTITNDDGTAGNFEYRVAVVAPGKSDGGERIVVCDSGKLSTNGSKDVSYDCSIPTLDGLKTLGVQNADERLVIPLKGGIAVFDSTENKSKKIHGKALIVNTARLQGRLDNALTHLDAFITRAQELVTKCDNITARAEEAGAENVIDRCTSFQEKMNEQIDKAAAAKERINNALSNLNNTTSLDFDDIKDSLKGFMEKSLDFKIETDDLKEFVTKARVDLEKKVAKEIVDKAKERAAEIRKDLLKERAKIDARVMDIEKKVMERKAEIRKEPKPTASGIAANSGSNTSENGGQ